MRSALGPVIRLLDSTLLPLGAPYGPLCGEYHPLAAGREYCISGIVFLSFNPSNFNIAGILWVSSAASKAAWASET